MILPVSPGRWQDRFGGGRENADIQPPLIDIMVPKGEPHPGGGPLRLRRPRQKAGEDHRRGARRAEVRAGVFPRPSSPYTYSGQRPLIGVVQR